ncbi:hypothetical protein K0M31_001116 [Melipona bicolor]|uniref:Uncharacterized protein n=1 Tax=Melipona bicolor TaxID=60889 RepID=A0AA40GG20_9HYME|nr:hypothetical protein K0M31_001116 [Melipona bicolor]
MLQFWQESKSSKEDLIRQKVVVCSWRREGLRHRDECVRMSERLERNKAQITN